MQDKPIALVTGANQGIGLQIAKDLAAKGFTVLVGSRDLARGEEAAGAIDGDAHALQLDVTDKASIAAAAARVRGEFGRLDVLVNNAAISNVRRRTRHVGRGIRPCDPTERRRPRRSARRLGDQRIRRCRGHPGDAAAAARGSPAARIVNVSSSVGSLTLNADPAFHYRSIFSPVYSASKTALNAMTLAMAIEREPAGIKVNAACPGFTKTNLNNFRGTQTVEEGAREPVRLALLGPDGPTGAFSNAAGPVPW